MLGSIILRLAALDEIGGILHPEDFRLPGHKALYRSLVAMHAAREGADAVTLTTRLKEAGAWALVGGAAGLVEISHHRYNRDSSSTMRGRSTDAVPAMGRRQPFLGRRRQRCQPDIADAVPCPALPVNRCCRPAA